MPATTDLLLRYLRAELDPDAQEAVRRRLDAEPDLRARLNRLAALDGALAASAAPSFGPYFAERVVRRLGAAGRAPALPSFADAIQGLFPRLALACLLAATGLAAYGGLHTDDGYTASTLDAVFGLPSVRYESLLYFEETDALPTRTNS
ncbi:MAG TPA: hypothetical protein VK610_10290 [Rhodothermales bacterium]|nr:hypothetical protein [Rhodothermales bacterium]